MQSLVPNIYKYERSASVEQSICKTKCNQLMAILCSSKYLFLCLNANYEVLSKSKDTTQTAGKKQF